MSELTKESARRGKTSISESPQKLLSDLELHSTEHLLLHSFVGIHECRDIRCECHFCFLQRFRNNKSCW